MTAAIGMLPGPMFLTPEQLADRWVTTTGHLANLRCKGLGPTFHKFETSVRYRIADIEAYELEREVLPIGAGTSLAG